MQKIKLLEMLNLFNTQQQTIKQKSNRICQMINFKDEKIQKMNFNYLSGQLDSFKNINQKGLFTFYLECQNVQKHLTPKKKTELKSKESYLYSSIDSEMNKTSPKRFISRQSRRYKTLEQQNDENDTFLNKNIQFHKKQLKEVSETEIDRIKDIFSFKRKSNQQILQNCLIVQQNNCKFNAKSQIRNKIYRHNNSTQKKYTQINYPLHIINDDYYLTCQPKNYKSLDRDNRIHHKKKTSENIAIETKYDIQSAISQLKKQRQIQNQSVKSIVFPVRRKHKLSFIKKNKHLTQKNQNCSLKEINDINLDLQIEGSSRKYQITVQNNLNQKQCQIQVPRGRKTPKSFLFNTIEKSILRSLQKSDEKSYQKDLSSLFKKRQSNLLKKRAQINDTGRKNISQLRIHNLIDKVQKKTIQNNINITPKGKSQIYDSTLSGQKVNELKVQNLFIKNVQKIQTLQMRKDFQKIISKIKHRYESI